MLRRRGLFAAAMLLFLWMAGAVQPGLAQAPEDTAEVDHEFVLESTMLGYNGIGGEIDGVRNPVLQAIRGEVVRITIVNGEDLIHDLKLEQLDVKTREVLETGERASVTFTAEESDTYFCTIPGHRAAGMVGRFEVWEGEIVMPVGDTPRRNGEPLNLDFETGTLENWTATGNAFEDQPTEGDVFAARGIDVLAESEGDARSGHNGTYWASSIVAHGPSAEGSLTSVSFEVTHPYASFLVSGGAFESTRVELVRTADKYVIYKISGADDFEMRPVVADLSSHVGDEIFIRLVDEDAGAATATYLRENPFAHINFDHFTFFEQRPSFPNEILPSEIETLPGWDEVTHAGLSAEDAAAAMAVPEGFSVTLAASEPDVVRPIALALDDRGRVWIAEARTYPERAPEGEGNDRILIFEDTDGDGTLDSRKVFMEGLNLVSAIELGFGGVWVGAAPYLLYIPIDESGDKPAGEPEILLDGWGYEDTHEMLNTFMWGPDGWLYGTHGVFTHSNVGKPGATDEQRTKLNGAVWRYHPTRHEFEIFAHGMSNPWGLDWNDYGHAFAVVCVIPHLHHIIPGARIERQAGEHFNPHTYDDLKAIGDHVHWVGNRGPHAGNRRSAITGGGHAHAGGMIYLGDSWPQEYRGRLFMNNIHGFRANTDILERKGSGYVGRHGPDFLLADDSWSQMLNFRYGPGGSVHVIDWYDKNQCHSPNPDLHDNTLGRIFKISHENDEWVEVDLQERSSEELVELQLHPNEWHVRHARLILQERGPDPAVHTALREILDENPDVTRKLRALWALHVTEGLSDADLVPLLGHESEYIRSWSVQLLAEDRRVSDEALEAFAQAAREDESALVRVYLASALQRIEPARRWEVIEGLHGRAEDAEDQNIPLMTWYATEPVVTLDMDRSLDLALSSELPRSLSFTVQRIAADDSQEALQILSERLGQIEQQEKKQIILDAINQIVQGEQTGKAE